MTDATVTWEQMKLLELEARVDRLEAMLDMKPVSVPMSSPMPSNGTAVSYASFDDNRARDSERLYQQVTGQITFPRSQADGAIADLSTVLDHYKTVDAAVADGKRVFARWCSKNGKSGKPYSAVNVGWLGWWLEEIAPRPDAQPQSFRERLARDLGVEL